MAWKTKPLGIVIDSSMKCDFAKLKAQGLAFVVIEAGTGLKPATAFAEQCNAAIAAGLPVLPMWIPVPAIDNYTYEQPAKDEIPVAMKMIAGRKINGLVVSVERWWVGDNTNRPATGNAISYTSNEFMRAFARAFPTLPVLCRSNDGFVKSHSAEMSVWVGNYPFYLADWRYRTRATDGSYTAYTFPPKVVAMLLSDVVAAMPPDDVKNPLIPGMNTVLKFWEFNGSVVMPLDLVKGWDDKARSVKAVLFNGTTTELFNFLGTVVPVDPPDDPVDPPDDPVDPPVTSGVDLTHITQLLEQMAADIQAIRAVFRE